VMIIFVYEKDKTNEFKALFCHNTIEDFVHKLDTAERRNHQTIYLPNYGIIHSVIFKDGQRWDACNGLNPTVPDDIEYYNNVYKMCTEIISAFAQENHFYLATERQKSHDEIKASLDITNIEKTTVAGKQYPHLELGRIGE